MASSLSFIELVDGFYYPLLLIDGGRFEKLTLLS
jgi:hypothetical protein